MDYVGLTVGIIGVGYGIWSDIKRRSDREWIHVALVNLKPSIDGPKASETIASINNMLEFLKPTKVR